MNRFFVFTTIINLFLLDVLPQQRADLDYVPAINSPTYDLGKGPIVFLDEGHHNFHTKNGRYSPFTAVLEKDGYVVKPYSGSFELKGLQQGKILVIANAINEVNIDDWVLPNPSAFTEKEIKTIKRWVEDGGSLFLIADHMPWPGATQDLAIVFGFDLLNGFVVDTTLSPGSNWDSFFTLKDQTLSVNSITEGRFSSEKITSIMTFTGQGFKVPSDAISILTFDSRYLIFLPDTAWVFNQETKRFNVEGLSQGAYKKFGKGRIVVFGEAGMFTAQISNDDEKFGMNHKSAGQNYQLLLNIIHWLDGLYD